MTLNQVKKRDTFRIISIHDNEIRTQAIRLGMSDGTEAKCVYKISGGPILLDIGGQEIAVGSSLAEKIEISETFF